MLCWGIVIGCMNEEHTPFLSQNKSPTFECVKKFLNKSCGMEMNFLKPVN
jgi:hypothetical protein